ncbi:hypothetical protein HMPREF9621_00396 [Cutibacterium modestum HL037PA2]|nr:hypothetical protein HMPREF9621_00396 [Cutibacterium modestum HL037PA2]
MLTDGPLSVGDFNGTNRNRMTTMQLTETRQALGTKSRWSLGPLISVACQSL